MSDQILDQLIFDGLKALLEAAFPKHCRNCGRSFATAGEFLLHTKNVRADISGLKQSFDEQNMVIVEAYRNCPCGSTLMDLFSDRRDSFDAGEHRRKLFNKLLPHLQEKA